jgi:AraC family transcriptional regulator
MKQFEKGKYLGVNKSQRAYGEIFMSNTCYTKEVQSDWHYHENPFFSFLLSGGSVENRKNECIECIAGQIYFYNWQEPHKNTNYQENTQNFNIELDVHWLKTLGITETAIAGSFLIQNPDIKFTIVKLFKEFLRPDDLSKASVHLLTLELLHQLGNTSVARHKPVWVNQLKEILHDNWSENLGLQQLASLLNIHPVTISKYFSRYFDCTLGEYVRKIRVEKALELVRSTSCSLSTIAYECGFADQSHFIRTFKNQTGFRPNEFRKLK